MVNIIAEWIKTEPREYNKGLCLLRLRWIRCLYFGVKKCKEEKDTTKGKRTKAHNRKAKNKKNK